MTEDEHRKLIIKLTALFIVYLLAIFGIFAVAIAQSLK